MHILQIIAHAVCALVGITFIYTGLFLYEDEDKSVKNYFLHAWLQLDDMSQSTTSRLNHLITAFTQKVVTAVNKIYGNQLLSFKAFFVSTCLSFASILIFALIVSVFGRVNYGWKPFPSVILLICVVIFYDVSLKASHQKIWLRVLFYLAVLSCLTVSGIAAFKLDLEFQEFSNWLLVAESPSVLTVMVPLIMIITDFIYIIMCRYLFLKLMKADKLYLKLLLICLNVAFFALVLISPVIGGLLKNERPISMAFIVIPLSSIHTMLLTLLHIIIILLYFLNLALWELIKRPVYALQKRGFFEHKKTFTAIGIFFIAIAVPQVGEWLGKYI
jgi:hypothetical protein